MILIRADANKTIGMGHVMRTLSLADELKSFAPVVFVVADDSVVELIRDCGFDVFVLHTDYKDMDSELEKWPEVEDGATIIVDSYFVTPAYLTNLRLRTRVVYIDDVLAFPYPVDVIVNYNAYVSSEAYHELYKGSAEPELILGPKYAPLRAMFRDVEKREQPEKVENVLISTGGSDELHLTIALLQKVMGRADGRKYHFLIGAMNEDKKQIRDLASPVDWVQVHENVVDMRSLICSMDLCVSAAGSTLYEISACGVPLITYSLADNQLPGASAFERLGLAVNVGDLRDPATINPNQVISGTLDPTAVDKILSAVDKLDGDYELRVSIGNKQQTLITARGAQLLSSMLMR